MFEPQRDTAASPASYPPPFPPEPPRPRETDGAPRPLDARATAHRATPPVAATGTRLQRTGWAAARLAFYAYIGVAMITVVGGFVTAPLMTHLFYNDWRFWRHWERAWRLFPHAWSIAWLMFRREGQFMLSVPLTSPPQSGPNHGLVELAPGWGHGASCGDCQRCCHILWLRCPVLDEATGFCSGYDSFYWRYFNCGRYPSGTTEIDYYGCDKWRMKAIRIEAGTRH